MLAISIFALCLKPNDLVHSTPFNPVKDLTDLYHNAHQANLHTHMSCTDIVTSRKSWGKWIAERHPSCGKESCVTWRFTRGENVQIGVRMRWTSWQGWWCWCERWDVRSCVRALFCRYANCLFAHSDVPLDFSLFVEYLLWFSLNTFAFYTKSTRYTNSVVIPQEILKLKAAF